jgi:hypothetical protein
MQLQIIMIHEADELDPAFAAMKSSGVDAVIAQPSLPRKRIAELALKNLIPALAPSMPFASEGGLAAKALAEEQVRANNKLSMDQAYSRVYADAKNRGLIEQAMSQRTPAQARLLEPKPPI